jgi:hypothetical protein
MNQEAIPKSGEAPDGAHLDTVWLFLPLLHGMEERAGEEVRGWPCLAQLPLAPLMSHGTMEFKRQD